MSKINGYIDSFASQFGWRQHGGLLSGISLGNTVIQTSGTVAISGFQNFEVQVFGGSGGLKYFGGPYEGWQVKMANLSPIAGSGLNGYFPIAVSGIFGLQDAYSADADIYVQTNANPGGNGGLRIITNDAKFTLVQGQRAPLNISGAAIVPVVGTNNTRGDIAMSFSAQVSQSPDFVAPTGPANSDARALGPGTLTINTGSGIVNVLTGSGIAFVTPLNDFVTATTVDNYVRIPISGMAVNDMMFTTNATGSGISFMNTGMFMVTYNVAIQKQAGATARTFSVRAVLLNKGAEGEAPVQGGGGAGPLNGSTRTPIPGSLAWGAVTNVTTLPWDSISASFLVNASAGQFLGFEIANQGVNSTPVTQAVSVSASGTYAIIQYIGPRRTFPVIS